MVAVSSLSLSLSPPPWCEHAMRIACCTHICLFFSPFLLQQQQVLLQPPDHPPLACPSCAVSPTKLSSRAKVCWIWCGPTKMMAPRWMGCWAGRQSLIQWQRCVRKSAGWRIWSTLQMECIRCTLHTTMGWIGTSNKLPVVQRAVAL